MTALGCRRSQKLLNTAQGAETKSDKKRLFKRLRMW